MISDDFTPPVLQKRFHELCDARDARSAKSTPLRSARDAFIAEAKAKEDQFNAAIRAAENPGGEISMYDLQKSIAAVAKALSGVTGERPQVTNAA